MVSENEVAQSGIFDFQIFPLPDQAEFYGKGRNAKGLLLVMADEETPESNSFLEKIVQAVGFDLEADALALWVTSAQSFWFSSPGHGAPFQHAIFFGARPSQAGLNLIPQLYNPLTINEKTFLFVDSLAKIKQDPSLKRPLWDALKFMFKK